MGRNMPLVGGAWPPLCYAVTCRASICRRNACVCDPSRCGASRMSGVTRRHRRQCMPGRMCYAVWPVGGVCPRLSSASTGECASAACVRVCEHASDCRVSAEVWHTPSPWERASVCRCPMLVWGSDTAWTRVRRQSAVCGGAWSVSYLPNRGCGLWLVRQASASHSSAKPFAHSPPSGVRAHAIPAHNALCQRRRSRFTESQTALIKDPAVLQFFKLRALLIHPTPTTRTLPDRSDISLSGRPRALARPTTVDACARRLQTAQSICRPRATRASHPHHTD